MLTASGGNNMTASTNEEIDTLPELYEDEGLEMGEALPHFNTEGILYYCLKAHFERLNIEAFVLPDMNLYYEQSDPDGDEILSYVSPDVMVVPKNDLPETLKSYRLGVTGPGPFFVAEILSSRTAQQGDLTLKPALYAKLNVGEYLLVDVTGKYLRKRLLLKTLGDDGQWSDQHDRERGVTSRHGFRVELDSDGRIRVHNVSTGMRYPRPEEAVAQYELNQQLMAEIARLKCQLPPTPDA